MAERREQKIRTLSADRADDVTPFTGFRIRAFHQCEIAVFGRAKQCLEVGAGVFRDTHGAIPSSPRKSSMISWVDLPLIVSAVMSTAMPPKPSGRIFEQVKDVTAVT